MVCYILGADVNKATTNNDHTVLSLACAGGHLTVVELLLKSGANASHKLKVLRLTSTFTTNIVTVVMFI